MAIDATPNSTVPGPTRAAAITGLLVVLVVFSVGLLWAKWLPYAAKAAGVSSSHTWVGSSILQAGGVKVGDPPSWAAAISFCKAYFAAVWKALLAALLISAQFRPFCRAVGCCV